jgi:hypothetical protein
VRLTPPGEVPSDTIDITPDTSVFAWPQRDAPAPIAEPAAPQTSTLSGSFGMQLDFGGISDGFGILGAVETSQGQFASMAATGFDISNFAPTCSTSDNPCTGSVAQCTQQPEVQTPGIALSSAGTGSGLLELFAGRFRGTLYLRGMVAGGRQSSCGSGLETTPITNDAARLPISIDGDFRVAPALSADGIMRLGVIRVTNPAAQRSNFALLHTCTEVSFCSERSYPLRLQVHDFTAEVLIGSGGAPSAP